MKTTKRDPLPHPSVIKKQDQLLYELRNSSNDPELLVDSLEDWLLELIDEALWPESKNTLTLGVGENDEISFPCFPN